LPILNSVDEVEWTELSLHFDIGYTVQKYGAFFATVVGTSGDLNLLVMALLEDDPMTSLPMP
jgi:hypothetical protein